MHAHPARHLSALLVLLLLPGCAPREEPVDLEAERAALLELDRQWREAAEANEDVELIVSYWSDDAKVIPPGQPPVVGKEALREMVSSFMEIPGFSVSWESEEVHVSADGRMAWMYGTNAFTFPDEEGNLVTTPGRAVTVWRKNENGEWKCAVDIWNEGPAAEAG